MGKPHGTDAAGRHLNLIGAVIADEAVPVSGVVVRRAKEREAVSAKAEQDGIYTLGGVRYQIRAGDELPEGAVIAEEGEPVAVTSPETGIPVDEYNAVLADLEAVKAERDALRAEKEAAATPAEPDTEERAKGKASQNRAKGPAPENRSN